MRAPAPPATPRTARSPAGVGFVSREPFAHAVLRAVANLLPRAGLATAALAALALGLAALGAFAGLGYHRLDEVSFLPAAEPRPASRPAKLERLIAGQVPAGVYLTIDTVGHQLFVKRGAQVLLAATCSTGTGGILTDPVSGRQWVFDTPHGIYHVLAKTKAPVWHKPDWAFVEEGLPIPKDPRQRLDDFSLGAYALDLGNGYLIHGTLYQRLLGRSVTHGCIRLGDGDLATVFRVVAIGTPVFIY